jgi:hypothetical protein
VTRPSAPDARGGPREWARERLRARAARERRRTRRLRRIGRATSAGIVLFVVWSLVPGVLAPEVVPLLGLADQVEALATTPRTPGTIWYARSARVELVTVPTESGAGELRVLVPAVHETWFGGDRETARRRVSYGAPRFLGPEDHRLVAGMDLVAAGIGRRQAQPPDPIEEAVDAGRAALVEALREEAAGQPDPRLQAMSMLQLSAQLVHRFGDEPAKRSVVVRAMADIPGIDVRQGDGVLEVSVDYVEGGRPLRLEYHLDAGTAQLVAESLMVLAGRFEPAEVLRTTRFGEPADPTSS